MLAVQDSAAYERFGEWVERQHPDAGKSSVWQGLAREFDARTSSTANRADLFTPRGFRAYSFYESRHETQAFVLRRLVLRFTHRWARAFNLLRAKVWNINLDGAGEPQLAFYPAGLRVLRELDLAEGYRRFCAHFSFSPHSASGVKAYYMASVILPYLDAKPNRVLEVGGGMANLAAVIQFCRPADQYVIVDLPEMLRQSALTLHALYPGVPWYFLFPGSGDSFASDRPGFYFCVPECVDQLTSGAFDLGCNVDSFQEMTEGQVTGYLAMLQRVIRPGGHLVTLNRRKYLDAERFDNNPLTYPYNSANTVKVWETDPFMHRVFNYGQARKDGWMLRVEQINP